MSFTHLLRRLGWDGKTNKSRRKRQAELQTTHAEFAPDEASCTTLTLPLLRQLLAEKFPSEKRFLDDNRRSGWPVVRLDSCRIRAYQERLRYDERRKSRQGYPRYPFRLGTWQDEINAATVHLPTDTKAALEANADNLLLRLPTELIWEIDGYLSKGQRIALRLASRQLFVNLKMPTNLGRYYVYSQQPYHQLNAELDMDIAFGFNRTAQLRALDAQGILLEHGAAFCSACSYIHEVQFFEQDQLAAPAISRSCKDWKPCPHVAFSHRDLVMRRAFQEGDTLTFECWHSGVDTLDASVPGRCMQLRMPTYKSQCKLLRMAPDGSAGPLSLRKYGVLLNGKIAEMSTGSGIRAATTIQVRKELGKFVRETGCCRHLCELLTADEEPLAKELVEALTEALVNTPSPGFSVPTTAVIRSVSCPRRQKLCKKAIRTIGVNYLDVNPADIDDEVACRCSLIFTLYCSQDNVQLAGEMLRLFTISSFKDSFWAEVLSSNAL